MIVRGHNGDVPRDRGEHNGGDNVGAVAGGFGCKSCNTVVEIAADDDKGGEVVADDSVGREDTT